MVSMIYQKILLEKSNYRVVLKEVCTRVSDEYAHIHNATVVGICALKGSPCIHFETLTEIERCFPVLYSNITDIHQGYVPGLEFDECRCGRVKPSFMKICSTCRDEPLRPRGFEPNRAKSRLDDSKTNTNEVYTPNKCSTCKNNAKKGSLFCTPCENMQSLWGNKDYNNQTKKGDKYRGNHVSLPNKSHLKCRICNKSIKSKSVIERVAKGTAGFGAGTYLGMIVGTIILPGFGTLIGGGLGALEGSKLGSQTSDICDNCCMLCEKKKINCTCYDIIGSCGSCGRNITMFDSSSGICNGCYDHGEDI